MATVLEITSQSALLILVLFALRPVFKRTLDARFRYALWLLPALRLMVPVSVQSTVSLWNIVRPAPPAGMAASGLGAAAQGPPPAIGTISHSLPAVSPVLNASSQGSASIDWAQLLPNLLMAVWILGSLTAFTLLIVKNIRFSKSLRGAKKIPANIPLPVLQADMLSSPCLMGLFRPRIIVTPVAVQSEPLLDMVLRHEWTHYRHRDSLWTALRGMLLCIWWWNPLVWLAAHVSREDCEVACDEAVISKMSLEDRQRYGMSLIALLGKKPCASSLLHTTTAMHGSKRAMKERITMIAHWKSKRRTVTVCAALCIALLVPFICTSAAGQAGEQTAPLADITGGNANAQDDGYIAEVYSRYFDEKARMLLRLGEYDAWSVEDKAALDMILVDGGAISPDNVIYHSLPGKEDVSKDIARRLAEETIAQHFEIGQGELAAWNVQYTFYQLQSTTEWHLLFLPPDKNPNGPYDTYLVKIESPSGKVFFFQSEERDDRTFGGEDEILPGPDEISEEDAIAIATKVVMDTFAQKHGLTEDIIKVFTPAAGILIDEKLGRVWMVNFVASDLVMQNYFPTFSITLSAASGEVLATDDAANG